MYMKTNCRTEIIFQLREKTVIYLLRAICQTRMKWSCLACIVLLFIVGLHGTPKAQHEVVVRGSQSTEVKEKSLLDSFLEIFRKITAVVVDWMYKLDCFVALANILYHYDSSTTLVDHFNNYGWQVAESCSRFILSPFVNYLLGLGIVTNLANLGMEAASKIVYEYFD